MSESDTPDNGYQPPRVWQWQQRDDHRFASINRPTAGATHERALPIGKHDLQLYSLATPNGVKVTVMLEELLELGISDAEYDAYMVNIMDGEQFGSGFVAINPNSKIPALVDYSHAKPARVFESGAILLYLAEKFDAFLPREFPARSECLSWLFWQMGATPYLGGGFGHFYAYAPEKLEYPIYRFALEAKRQLDLLDKHLADKTYMCGDEYTIADMAIAPWYGLLVKGELYGAEEFLQTADYVHLARWAETVSARPGYQRGCMVNRGWGEPHEQLPERHSASDFDKIPPHPER